MSFYAYDANGYCGDLASIGGWRDFAVWSHAQGGAVSTFANTGYTTDPNALQKQLADASASGSNESIRANLLSLARKAEEILIISDGEDSSSESAGSGQLPTRKEYERWAFQ